MSSPAAAQQAARSVVVLGSTGSIGVNALAVIEHLTRSGQQPYRVVGLAAGSNANLLAEQAQRFGCPAVAVAQAPTGAALQAEHRFTGPDAATQLIQHCQPDVVVAAIVGVAGLAPTVAAIELGCTVALANKETLVAAGAWVMPLIAKHGATLLPIDSEHSAIFQCLPEPTDPRTIRRVVLTASGGPFRETPAKVFRDATPEQALNHPTWNMGPKNTIDSATLINKGLEVIEAHHMFGLPAEKIDVLVHPQSFVHGFVEFSDHSVVAQMGPPDMRTPIQVALSHPQRVPGCSDQTDWTKLCQLDFHPPDTNRFPAIELTYEVIRRGGTAGAVFNAANEAAVQAFLEHKIRFGRIVELVAEALAQVPTGPITGLADVMAADQAARQHVQTRIQAEAQPSR